MDRIQRQCKPVQGVAYGQTPTLDLQLGPRYRYLLLEIIAAAAAAVGEGAAPTLVLPDVLGDVIVKIGGNPQRTHSAVQLDAINRSYGAQYGMNAYNFDGGALTYVNGVPQGPQPGKQTVFYLPIFFREPWRQSYAAKEMMAWYTSWQDGSVLPSFSLALTIPPASPNVLAGSAISINAYAETDNAVGPLDANKNPVAMITKWKRQQIVYGGAGDLVITTLNKQEVYNQISLFSAYLVGAVGAYIGPIPGNTPAKIITDQNDPTKFDAISHVKVEVDNRTVRDVSKIVNDQELLDDDFNESGLPADRFDVCFDKSDLPTDGLVMQSGGSTVQDFRITATLAAAAAQNKSLQALMQIYGAIER
jgi:hypothetical protein